MTETIDELGPVDYLVVEFPGSKFNGEIAPTLVDLVDRGIIRVLDLVMIQKEADGTFEAFELSDIDDGEAGDLRKLETEIAEVLSADDVANAAAALEPGSTAGMLVYENFWAAPFAFGRTPRRWSTRREWPHPDPSADRGLRSRRRRRRLTCRLLLLGLRDVPSSAPLRLPVPLQSSARRPLSFTE